MEDLLTLLSPSRMRLVEFMNREGVVTVDGAVEALGLAETTIRQHLDRLERKGLVTHHSVVHGPGRPTLEYRLTERGMRLFPNQDGHLLGRLLQFVIQEGYPRIVDDFFHDIWAERRDQIVQRFEQEGADTLPRKLEILEDFLEEQGFLPEIKVTEDRVTIRECNCPFSESVRATRLPCRLEAKMFEQLLQRDLARVGFMPDGQPACEYEFDLAEEAEEDRAGPRGA